MTASVRCGSLVSAPRLLLLLLLSLIWMPLTALINNKTTTTTTTRRTMPVSLWLLPPNDDNNNVYQQYHDEIHRLATLRHDAAGITFVPHITLVGGVSTTTTATTIDTLIQTVHNGLAGFGPIECALQRDVVFETDDKDQRQAVWNQAAVLVVQPNDKFDKLCALSRQLMGLPTTRKHNGSSSLFAGPIYKPHLSLYYGRQGVPATSDMNTELPLQFTATRVALWSTPTPANNEMDVPLWRQLAVVDLV